MVSGNVAAMLKSIVAVGRDHVDCGRWLLPRLRIEGLVLLTGPPLLEFRASCGRFISS